MPTYEYYCPDCDETFEAIQKISENPLKKCPKGHKGVKRQISNTSFILKGTGWYVTDYGRKDNKGGASGKAAKAAKELKDDTAGSKKAEAPKATKCADSCASCKNAPAAAKA